MMPFFFNVIPHVVLFGQFLFLHYKWICIHFNMFFTYQHVFGIVYKHVHVYMYTYWICTGGGLPDPRDKVCGFPATQYSKLSSVFALYNKHIKKQNQPSTQFKQFSHQIHIPTDESWEVFSFRIPHPGRNHRGLA